MLDAYPGMELWHREVPQSPRLATVLGIGALLLGVLGFGAWAALAPLNGAVVASGSFVATGQNKQVQHLEGGIIRDILAKEGDLVEAGQILIRLDEISAKSRLRRLVLKKYHALAMQARFDAQISGKEEFAVPLELAAQPNDGDVKTIFDRERMELAAYREEQRNEEEVLRKEISGLKESIGGYQAQLTGVEQRLALFTEELIAKKSLLDRQLTRKTEVFALQRAEAGVSGERGELIARIADAKEKIARAEQQIAQVHSAAMQKAVEELREAETQHDDVVEQIRAEQDVLNRLDVRAPVRGIIVKLNHHAQGAVVAPGSVILELLPVNDELIVEVRVKPSDITHVKEGQQALVRLTAFNQRMTPAVSGRVVYVSADSVSEQEIPRQPQPQPVRTNSFVIRVALDQQEAARKVAGFRPMPGMPADVYIQTGERTLVEYLVRPLLDSLSRGLREP
jgi:HlyD family type I secretion membrane fusion protein